MTIKIKNILLDDSQITEISEISETEANNKASKKDIESTVTESNGKISIKLHHFKFDITNPYKSNTKPSNITNKSLFINNNNNKAKNNNNSRCVHNKAMSANNSVFKNLSNVENLAAGKMILTNGVNSTNEDHGTPTGHISFNQHGPYGLHGNINNSVDNKINRQAPIRKKTLPGNQGNAFEINGGQINTENINSSELSSTPENRMNLKSAKSAQLHK